LLVISSQRTLPDEATSALDATSRILVFEAIKRWRHNKTTIVITHDLSQISHGDFVYVLKGGRVVEQGYRADLETSSTGEFREMMDIQGATGGFLPTKDETQSAIEEFEVILQDGDEKTSFEGETVPFNLKHQSLARPSIRPITTLGTWMFDVVADLTKAAPTPAIVTTRRPDRVSRFIPAEAFSKEMQDEVRKQRPSSIHSPSIPSLAHTAATRRYSLQFTPTSPVFEFHASRTSTMHLVEDDLDFDDDKAQMQRRGAQASSKRKRNARPRARWDDVRLPPLTTVKVEKSQILDYDTADTQKQLSLWSLIRDVYPTVPCKSLVVLGVVTALFSGAMTPIFSYLLARLMFEVSIGAKDTSTINMYGGIVLSIAALDGLLLGFKYFVMETSGAIWVTRVRNACFKNVLAQDKKWFDRSENSPVRIVQVLIKDGDDARNLIAVVLAQFCVVVAMLGVGLVWALVRGWQLTLVGFAIAPVFAITMAVQTNLVAKCEFRNKRAREEVAKGYYEVRLLWWMWIMDADDWLLQAISNIRSIRSMGFESVFQAEFDSAADKALSTGVQGACVEGCTYGVASALIYLAEALLFYVGAVLIARGTYSYLQMVQVVNLVVFSVTIGSQLMVFSTFLNLCCRCHASSDVLLLVTDSSKDR
jgi:ATP-binding cassette subfamily B (MDR/TAP) protein 1